MDNLNMVKAEEAKTAPALYAHIRCSVEQFNEIERIARLCNMNKRKVCDELLAFALRRVKLIERPLYDLELHDLEDKANDENQ